MYVGRGVEGVDWKVDAVGAGAIVWGMLHDVSQFDLGQSLSSGAVVYRNSGNFALPGTVFYGRTITEADAENEAYVFAHEKVHVLQYDQGYFTLGSPLEDWIGGRFSFLQGTLNHLELFNIPFVVAVGLAGERYWAGNHQQPWEKEAKYLGLSRGW